MKIVLFDQVNETHACASLQGALRRIGHEVEWTGRVWRGFHPPVDAKDCEQIDARLEEALALRPDALLNFRASSLLPRHLERLRAAGVRTLVWLPDDPVLYKVCYAGIVDHYDVPLHCGSRRILEFYRYRGHRPGMNFPFWVDAELFAYRYDPANAVGDAVFFGHMTGPAKKKRYEMLCDLHPDVTLHGKAGEDPRGKCKGEIKGAAAAVEALSRYRIGLNVAQSFIDYLGTEYDYPGLAMLGSYFLPSRVLQYAAIGLPTLTLQDGGCDAAHYPPGFHAASAAEARELLARLLRHEEPLRTVSRAARGEVERVHGPAQRARLLDGLLSGAIRTEGMSVHEQEFAYRWC